MKRQTHKQTNTSRHKHIKRKIHKTTNTELDNHINRQKYIFLKHFFNKCCTQSSRIDTVSGQYVAGPRIILLSSEIEFSV